MGSESTTPSALMLIAEHRLRDEVRRIAAAADRHLDEQSAPPGRRLWTEAALVVLDSATVATAELSRYPRRSDTILVTEGEPALPDWQAAATVGADRVFALPDDADRLIEAFAESEATGADGTVVAVAGATGGAGASVLTAAIAIVAATRRFRPETVVVDGDRLGGGIDLLLGVEAVDGLRWPDLVVRDGRVAASALHAALPAAAPGLGVLACGRALDGRVPDEPGPAAVQAVLSAARGAGDLVVCDVSGERGPHTDRMLDAADLVVLVVPARLRAVAAAQAVSAYIGERNTNQTLIVRGPAPGGLRAAEVADALGLPLLAAIRAEPGLDVRLERGGLALARGPLRTAAEAVLAELGGGTR
ncbi:septum site-determining protein Ssd [Nocardia sp. BMG111209]|uniref:septum site-determining protein Ssd n=1 Tax=Nocardia sp. BMG111209 TaxID=1160137 RepID=UPI0004782B20|nr:septum site-determining protein Ssd [Nocardia sp. BMG111209]